MKEKLKLGEYNLIDLEVHSRSTIGGKKRSKRRNRGVLPGQTYIGSERPNAGRGKFFMLCSKGRSCVHVGFNTREAVIDWKIQREDIRERERERVLPRGYNKKK